MTRKTRYNVLSAALWLGVIVILSLTSVLNTGTSQAQGPEGGRKTAGGTLNSIPAEKNSAATSDAIDEITNATTFGSTTVKRQGRINIIVELTEPTVVDVLASQSAALTDAQEMALADAQNNRVTIAQQALLANLSSRGITYTLTGTTSQVLSAVFVNADASALETINGLPGVKSAYEEHIGTFDNATSVPFVGAPVLWSNGRTGQGVRVGLIDSGIDYSHANFGGSGVAHAAGVCDPADFPSAKVAGGYDFVGNSWSPGAPLVPDADPCDQNGHGSHVGGTIAGYGVTGAGATYTGPWDSSTPFGSMTIGPGMAPGAQIYIYKVGSSSNYVSEQAAILALEAAADPNGDNNPSDHLDVVNMSIGGDFGDPNIGWAAAANDAAKAGVVVVSSAGNAGDSYFIQGDPSTADWAIAVAASAAGSLGWEALWNSGAVTYEAAAASFGPQMYSVTAPVQLANDGVGTVTDACTALPAGSLTGKIALIDRGTCGFVVKVKNAQNAGAVGVLVANTSTGSFGGLGGADATITIPSVMIQYADGQTLRSGLPVNAHMALGTSDAVIFGGSADTVASFSSRGPQRQVNGLDVGLKPDITAPGEGIVSTAMGTGSGGVSFSGTSMASPHVAGAVALLRQDRHGWPVDEIKALVLNTASHYLYLGTNQTPPLYGPGRVGTGRLDVARASMSPVILYDATRPERVNVSFGIVDVSAPTTLTRNITVENKSSNLLNYELRTETLVDINGPYYTVSPTYVTVGPNSTTTVTVTLNLPDPNTWSDPHTHDPTVNETQFAGYPRAWLSEEAMLIRFVPKNVEGVELWMPVYSAPRPAGTLESVLDTAPLPGTTGLTWLEETGTGINTPGTAYPYIEDSLVSAFELLYEAGPLNYSHPPLNSGVMQYVGVTTDYNGVSDLGGDLQNNSHIYFGISAYENWSSLSEETWFAVYIDADQNGSADYIVSNWNLGAYTGGDSNDQYISYLSDAGGGHWYGDYVNDFWPDYQDTRPMQTNVLFLPMWAGAMGLTNADGAFDFQVVGYQMNGGLVDVTPVLTYDALAQQIDFNHDDTDAYQGAPVWWEGAGPSVPVNYDFTSGVPAVDPCILLLHHENIPGMRSEKVCLSPSTAAVDVAVTKAVNNPSANKGDSVTYTVTAINNDTLNPIDVTVNDALPSGVVYASHTASQGTYDAVAGSWTGITLAAGGSATLAIAATVSDETGTTITNTATIAPVAGIDVNPDDNEAQAIIQVGGVGGAAGEPSLSIFDPAISKVGVLEPGGLGLPGESLTWTITVTNNGSGTATNVVVSDTLQSELSVNGADIDTGSVSISGQTVTFTIPSLAPGASVQMRVYTTVLSSPLSGQFLNTASVTDGAVSQSASATVGGVGALPSTGYPPADTSSGPNAALIAGAAALALLTLGGAVLLRRRLLA